MVSLIRLCRLLLVIPISIVWILLGVDKLLEGAEQLFGGDR